MSNFFLDSVKDDTISSLNDTSDLTRMAYSNKSSDIPLRNSSMTDRFESDTFINHKESFENNNSRINSLNDEIRELKDKLKLVYEKDKEIQNLKNELSNRNALMPIFTSEFSAAANNFFNNNYLIQLVKYQMNIIRYTYHKIWEK